jgi:probable phosphoglycerate mutase
MTRIILTRHGEVEGLDPERFRGRADVPLTPRGARQAGLTARRIAAEWKPAAIYTSPLRRAVETGRAIGEALNLRGVALTELNDLDYGAWQWKTLEAARAEAPVLFDLWHSAPHLMRFPGGESLQDLAARTADALRLVLARHPGDTIVLVGHDSVNRALLTPLLSQPLSAYWRIAQSPCGVSEILIENGAERVLRINETLHLLGAE